MQKQAKKKSELRQREKEQRQNSFNTSIQVDSEVYITTINSRNRYHWDGFQSDSLFKKKNHSKNVDFKAQRD